MPPLRLNKRWIHKIWSRTNECICRTHPNDNKKLEALIAEFSEPVVLLAWAIFVEDSSGDDADGDAIHAYNLKPVKTVHKWVSRAGKEHVDVHEDTSAITRFPLAAFLATSDAYVLNAQALIETNRIRYSYGTDIENLVKSVTPPAVASAENGQPKHPTDTVCSTPTPFTDKPPRSDSVIAKS